MLTQAPEKLSQLSNNQHNEQSLHENKARNKLLFHIILSGKPIQKAVTQKITTNMPHMNANTSMAILHLQFSIYSSRAAVLQM